LKIDIEIDEKDLKEMLKDANLLTPVEAGFSVPYASEVEYGTGPGTITPFDELDEWARLKLDMRNTAEREKFVNKVIENHYRRGKLPHPFFQPAINKVIMNINKIPIQKEGIYAISGAIISESKKNIESKGIAHKGNLGMSGYARRVRE